MRRTVAFILLGCLLAVAAGRTAFAGPADEDLSTVAMSGDITAIRQALANGADVNKVDNTGHTPLYWAAIEGRVDKVKFLLAHGADVNKADRFGDTPLSEAAFFGHVDVVKVLLARGATPKPRDLNGAKGESRTLIQEALNGASPSSFGPPVVAQTDTPPSVSATPQTPESPAQPTPSSTPAASGELSKIEQLIEAQNKEIQSLKARNKTSLSTPSAPVYHTSVDRPSYHAPENRRMYAVVIGVENYPGGIHKAEFADRDAQAVFHHLLALGVPVRHIKRLTDETATRGRIHGALHWLNRNVRSGSTVYVYFSGHGAPSQGGTAYLVPFDGDPSDLSDTGVSTSGLYKGLEKLPAKHIIVALDACFTGEGKRSILGNGVRPLVTKIREGAVPSSGHLVVLTAARSNQESGVLDSKGHGLFTYYFLKGLNGGAESGGHVTVAGLYHYLKPKVQNEANLDNRSQTPELEPRSTGQDASVRIR